MAKHDEVAELEQKVAEAEKALKAEEKRSAKLEKQAEKADAEKAEIQAKADRFEKALQDILSAQPWQNHKPIAKLALEPV